MSDKIQVTQDGRTYSSFEDMLTRRTTEYVDGQAVSEHVEYSDKLEAFIRKIVREEITKAVNEVTLNMRGR